MSVCHVIGCLDADNVRCRSALIGKLDGIGPVICQYRVIDLYITVARIERIDHLIHICLVMTVVCPEFNRRCTVFLRIRYCCLCS